MGLLTDPGASEQRSKLALFLIKGNRKICLLFYVAGLIGFCALGHTDLNTATYFSENALLQGLVYSEIKSDTINYALSLQSELERERETHPSTIPYPWLLAKMKQIGLETYTHNFTVNYPLGGGRTFHGKNVYGILRAPRIAAVESLILTAPYRPPNSVHPKITQSVPLMLAFAKFSRKQKYWAKDIIFLVTDQEQLGMQAWLDAYHGLTENEYLDVGILEDRAGAIQAAINLEMQSFDPDFIDVKIEGLNGQLPNLDLVNLVQRLSLREGVQCGHRQTSKRRRSGSKSGWEENLKHMLGMVVTQSTGVPTGNHGLFHRYGIEAVTMDAKQLDSDSTVPSQQRQQYGAGNLLKIIEGVFRSLNNLLERFHQSYFFYLLVASDRFVSIGHYTPCLGLMAGALLIKSFIIWLKLNQPILLTDPEPNFNFSGSLTYFVFAHVVGVATAMLPFYKPIDGVFNDLGLRTESYLAIIFSTVVLLVLFVPFFIRFDGFGMQVFQMFALFELGTVLIIVGLLNFSLALLVAVFVVPFAILVEPNEKWSTIIAKPFCLLLNPLLAIYLIVLTFTWQSFGELDFMDLLLKAWKATLDAVTFSVVDSMLYGNWMFDFITIILFPIWLMFWTVLCGKSTHSNESTVKLKTN